MFVSINWIQEFVDLNGENIEDLIQQFTLTTAEVENIYYKGRDTEKVVVGEILSIEDHPQSNTLHLLKINIGKEIYDCICGASNVRIGMKVAFACEGGKVSGAPVRKNVIAGYNSSGMCCSEKELGISDDHSSIMEINDDIPLGTDIKKIYNLEDIIFEVDNKSLTNRPDLWGHYGIAREFSTIIGKPLKNIDVHDCTQYSSLTPVKVDIEDTENVFRYTSLKINNIKAKSSPVNIKIKLFYCGIRPINLLTDLTNYIMLELGQPMHAFDSKKVDSIKVMQFDKPFEFKTLDSVNRIIDENSLMICSNNTPVAIAGIMGGIETEIGNDTDSLLLESANFDGVAIRKTSTTLGLRSDASMRYEKILDPEMTTLAVERFVKKLKDIDRNCIVSSSMTDIYIKRYDLVTIEFDKKYIDRYTGINITVDEIISTLTALGFVVRYNNGNFSVDVPSWRATKDVKIKASIVEEITRIYGYDNFAISTTKSDLRPVNLTTFKNDEYSIKDVLVTKFNLHEVHSYIWSNAKKFKQIGISVDNNIRIINALSPDNQYFRKSMIPTLLSFVNDNKSYKQSFGIFEIAKTVNGLHQDGTCNEEKKLGVALFSRSDSERNLFLHLRDIVAYIGHNIKHVKFEFDNGETTYAWQHPKNTAHIYYYDIKLGYISVLHPYNLQKIDKKASIVFAEIDMDILGTISNNTIGYIEPTKYPGIDVDLSFVVSENTRYSDLEEAWTNLNCPILKDVALIDVFEAESTKSITVRLSFLSSDKTLTRNEIQGYVDTIINFLENNNIYLKS